MNYVSTLITVAPDTSAQAGKVPPVRGKKSIAALEYELISSNPYAYTQEEVQFLVHLERQGIAPPDARARHDALWQEFFSKPRACMRTSPLAKTYGFGLHFNVEGKVGLVPMESTQYKRLAQDASIVQRHAMRSTRA